MPVFLFLSGLCFGSFLNVVICRIPLGESIIYPRSNCPFCKTQILYYDLIPIISWVILKGRCRYCKTRISIKYPFVELLTALVFIWAYRFAGYSLHLLSILILALVLIAVSFIDWENGIIPFSILSCAAVPGLGFAALNIGLSLTDAIFGGLIGGGFILAVDIFSRLVFKRPGMGGGDVALMLTAGLFLGFENTLLALFLAVISGGIYACILLVAKIADRTSTFAFGPFLAAGCWIALLYGNKIINGYVMMRWVTVIT